MSDFLLDIDEDAVEAEAPLADVAEDIAVTARRRYRRHDLQTDDPEMGVVVEDDSEGLRTTTHNPFAHLDEFDRGESGFQGPSAAMRSAAAEQGRYVPE